MELPRSRTLAGTCLTLAFVSAGKVTILRLLLSTRRLHVYSCARRFTKRASYPTLSSKHSFNYCHLLSLLNQEKALDPRNTDSVRSLTFDMEQERVEPTPQEKKPNMSSLTRRACYKCGNVGHYAEMCSSTERLCYNCKQPGHESNGCPHPRTTESQ